MLSSKLQSPVIKRGEERREERGEKRRREEKRGERREEKGARLRYVIFNHRSLVFQYIGGAASLIFTTSTRQHKQGGDGYGGWGGGDQAGKWRLAKVKTEVRCG